MLNPLRLQIGINSLLALFHWNYFPDLADLFVTNKGGMSWRNALFYARLYTTLIILFKGGYCDE
jgi:hypothetical protein